MDRLPVEILDNICADYLPVWDVPNFRLVCRAFSRIGARYLLPEISVAFLPRTFARFKAISEHPVISQYVNTIIYQVDVLPKIRSIGEYKNFVHLPVPARLPSLLRPSSSQGMDARTYRRQRRDLLKTFDERVQESNKITMEGWKWYKDLYRQQETILSSDTPMEVLGSTLTKFPRLKRVVVQTQETEIEESIPSLRKDPFRQSLVTLDLPVASHPPCGVLPLRNLLLSAFTAKTNLQDIYARYISFKFFDCDEDMFARIKSTVRYVHHLVMEVASTDDRLSINEDEENSGACSDLFDSGRFREFLTAAPDLRRLWLLFDWPVTLESVFGGDRWNFLRSLHLGTIDTQEDVLLAFFKRHATTLKQLALRDIVLTGPTCSFKSVFLKIPEILDLEFTYFTGTFLSSHPGTVLVMETWVPWLEISMGEAIEIVVCRCRLESLPEDLIGGQDDVRVLRKHILDDILA